MCLFILYALLSYPINENTPYSLKHLYDKLWFFIILNGEIITILIVNIIKMYCAVLLHRQLYKYFHIYIRIIQFFNYLIYKILNVIKIETFMLA